MYYCNNCKKKVNNKKDLYKGLCKSCYHEYLLNKIENIGEPEPLEKTQKKLFIKKFFLKLFKK